MKTILLGLGIAIILLFIYTQNKNKQNSIKEIPHFIESATFSGSKKGYIYKMDSEGLGYYLDEPKI